MKQRFVYDSGGFGKIDKILHVPKMKLVQV
jgi:hypothetical protein